MTRLNQSVLFLAAAATVGFFAQPSMAQVYTPGYGAPAYTPPGYAPAPPGYVAVPSAPSYQPVPVVRQYAYALTPDQIDQLMAPIALYPDPLLANILPAATYLEQVNEVAISLRANPSIDDNYINAQPWPESVKVLAHYPVIITLMTSQPDWTESLGAAFVEQQGDIMASIQRLRAEAQAAGALYTNPQQQVVTQGSYIEIVPAQQGVVYVPQYDPTVVYVRGRAPRDPIHFDAGLRINNNLHFDFDWDHHVVGVGAHWDGGQPVHDSNFHAWQHDDKFGHPTLPPPVAQHFNDQARRGYVPPAPQPVFNANQNRADVQRAVQRAQDVHPQPQAGRGPVVIPGRDDHGPGDRGDRGNGPGNDNRFGR